MVIEIRLDWTPNQWRRFLGQSDTTPLVELMSVMFDKMMHHYVDRELELLNRATDDLSCGKSSAIKTVNSGSGR